MNSGWLRFALVCEFLLAIVAVFTLWSQVGGQGHLDMMTWQVKLLLGAGLSAALVGMTAALMTSERVLSRRVVVWTVLAVLLAVAMGLVTMYYHVHEATDDSDEESSTAGRVIDRPVRL